MATERVEQEFHDQMWGLANNSMRLERAASDARALAYRVLNECIGDEHDTTRYMAERWLGEFGRDPLREARNAQEADPSRLAAQDDPRGEADR